MLKKLKEHWFIATAVVLLIGALGFFVYEQNKDKLPGKKIDGQDVVVEINGDYIFADQLFDDIDQSTKNSILYMYFERMVVTNGVKTTADIKSEAKLQAEQLITAYKDSYGSTWEEKLVTALKGVGYEKVSDLETYFINSIKAKDILINKIEENKTAYVQELVTNDKARMVSHILVAMSDPNNPTDEELAKIKAIEEALASGKSFGDVAKEFSDDTGSAANYGSLGYTDKSTKFVTEFLNAALALEEGQTSEWVKTDYGYHLIKVDAATVETLLANEDIKNDIYNAIDVANPTLYYEAIWQLGQDLGVTFATPELETSLKTYMGLGE